MESAGKAKEEIRGRWVEDSGPRGVLGIGGKNGHRADPKAKGDMEAPYALMGGWRTAGFGASRIC